jgi:succinylglutamate desuccinylase
MEITPGNPQFFIDEENNNTPTKIVEKEVIVDRPIVVRKEVIVDRPVIVEKEKIVKVKDINLESIVTLINNISTKLEDLKSKNKESLDQLKYVASDPQQIKKLGTRLETIQVEISRLANQPKEPSNDIRFENLRKDLNLVLTQVSNLAKPKDYSRDIESIQNSINNLAQKDLGVEKFEEVKQYLTLIKQSVDKVEVKPEVRITTQQIEDTKTRVAVEEVTKAIGSLLSLNSSQSKESGFKLDVVKSLIEAHVPSIFNSLTKLQSTLETQVSGSSEIFLKTLKKSSMLSDIKSETESALESHLTYLNSELNRLFSEIFTSIGSEFEAYREQFTREINQRLFDINLDLKSSVASILKEELNQFLSRMKIDTDSSDGSVLSLLSTIKETIRSEKAPRTYLVSTIHALNQIESPMIGDTSIVKKVNWFKRNQFYTWNGTYWETY